MVVISELWGDLVCGPADCSFVHCTAKDGHLGGELGERFKRFFPGLESKIKAQNPKLGGLTAVDKGDGHYIFSLVIRNGKSDTWPSFVALDSCLRALRKRVEEGKIARLAMSSLDCGNRLNDWGWPAVRHMISEIFNDVDVQLTVFHPTLGYYKVTDKCRYCHPKDPSEFIHHEHQRGSMFKGKHQYLVGHGDNELMYEGPEDHDFVFILPQRTMLMSC